jgi:hypothetical protein
LWDDADLSQGVQRFHVTTAKRFSDGLIRPGSGFLQTVTAPVPLESGQSGTEQPEASAAALQLRVFIDPVFNKTGNSSRRGSALNSILSGHSAQTFPWSGITREPQLFVVTETGPGLVLSSHR